MDQKTKQTMIDAIAHEIYNHVEALDSGDCCDHCRHDLDGHLRSIEENDDTDWPWNSCSNCNSYNMQFEISRAYAKLIAQEAVERIEAILEGR